MQIKEFIDQVYGDQQGWVEIMTRDPETGELTSERWFEYPKWSDTIAQYCEMRSDEDVYCSVAVFPEKHRQAQFEDTTAQAIWADADSCPPEAFRVPPSITVETSPGRWHVWWLLEEPVKATDASLVAQKIFQAHQDEGCDAGWTHTKILRVPGTSNLKRGEAHPVTGTFTGEVFSIDEIDNRYRDVEAVAAIAFREELPEPLSLSQRTELEDRVISGSPFENLYTEVPPDGSSWYKRLYRLHIELFNAGLDPQEVFDLAQHAACNKYARDNRKQSDLWKDVQKAYSEFAHSDVPDMVVPTTRVAGTSVPPFLTDAEEENLPETFVDRYAAYVATRTDSPETYQRSLAFMILSAVFADRGHLPLLYGDKQREPLNLWSVIVGPTTVRKTTALNICLEFIEAYEVNGLKGEKINIGSNATKEALVQTLGPRDGLVSLFQTDEVAMFFNDAFHKQYLDGLLGMLTELYDGKVPVVLRATKGAGQTERATTRFLFIGAGIDAGNRGVANILTKADFESGFLARMLWSWAPAEKRKKGSNALRWTTNTPAKDNRPDIGRMVTDLCMRSKKFDPENPSDIRFSPECDERYVEFTEDIEDYLDGIGDATLDAASHRLMTSTAKAAALLAMYDGKKVVEMEHLLPAIAQAQNWYRDMIHMYQQIASSGFEKQCDDVEKYIAQGTDGSQQESAVKRKFPMRPQEIGDILTALKAQGRIRYNGSLVQVLS